VVLERPDLLQELARRHGARDTTQRQSVMAELEGITPHRSQYVPGTEIPERSWAYRLAKRLAFHDYGVYGKHFRTDAWVDPGETSGPPSASQRPANPIELPVLPLHTTPRGK
jgi:hypothetical protein